MLALLVSIIFIVMIIGIIYLINPILSKKIINFIKAKLVNSTKIINILYGLYCLIIYLLYQYFIAKIIFKDHISYDIMNSLLFTFLFFCAILLSEHEPSNIYYPNAFLYNSSFILMNIIWLGQMLFEIGLFIINESIDDFKKKGEHAIKDTKFFLITAAINTIFMLPFGIYYAPITFISHYISGNIFHFGPKATRFIFSDEKLKEFFKIIEQNLKNKRLYFLTTYIIIYIVNIGILFLLLLIINPPIKLYVSYKNFEKNEKIYKIKKI